jgi:uncharacterized protein YllA (UPF0747 family)
MPKLATEINDNSKKIDNDDNLRIKSQVVMGDAKKRDKFFLIAINVYPDKFEVNFSENLNKSEIITAFAMCAARIVANLNETEKNKWIQYFLNLFPENNEQANKQINFLNNPIEKIAKNENDFILFVVDFTERSCDLKAMCAEQSRIVVTHAYYWAYQVMGMQLGQDSFKDLIKAFEILGLIVKK